MSLYPLGNALTESMSFTARDGTQWLAYIEGIPADPPPKRRQAVLPGRRLRFDSVTTSRVTGQVPSGSPFLPDAWLQVLLDQAGPLPLVVAHQPARGDRVPPRPLGDWAALGRRWKRLVVAAIDAVLIFVEGVLVLHRRARSRAPR